MNNTWQNHRHCAISHLKSQFRYFMFSHLLRVNFHSPSSVNWDLFYSVAPFCLSFLTRRGWFSTCQSLTSVSLWFETEKNPSYKLKTRSNPLMLGKQCCQRTCPQSSARQPACGNRVTGRMWLCLLAPGHIPFCLGLKYQTHTLLNYLMKIL